MRFNFKNLSIFLVFVIFNIFLILMRFFQINNNIVFTPSLLSNVNISSFIISTAFLIFAFIALVFSFSMSKNISNTKLKFNLVFGLLNLFSSILILFDIIIYIYFKDKNVDFYSLELVFLILTFIAFLGLSLYNLKIIKINLVYYFMLSPVFLFLIKLIRNFSSEVSASKISSNYLNIIFICSLLLFMHFSLKFLISGNYSNGKSLMIFSGFICSLLGFISCIPTIILYFSSTINLEDTINTFSNLGFSIYSISFLVFSTVLEK